MGLGGFSVNGFLCLSVLCVSVCVCMFVYVCLFECRSRKRLHVFARIRLYLYLAAYIRMHCAHFCSSVRKHKRTLTRRSGEAGGCVNRQT